MKFAEGSGSLTTRNQGILPLAPTLTNINSSNWITGKVDYALRFNYQTALTQSVYVGLASANIIDTFSIAFWARALAAHQTDTQASSGTTGTSGQSYAFSSDKSDVRAGVGISIGTNGISVYEHASNYMPALLVWVGNVSDWTFVTLVYTMAQPLLYINGQLVQRGLKPQTGQLYMNTIGTGPYGNYIGDLDEIRVYNRSLGPSEIISLYNSDRYNSELLPRFVLLYIGKH